jgi:hypothetical protein
MLTGWDGYQCDTTKECQIPLECVDNKCRCVEASKWKQCQQNGLAVCSPANCAHSASWPPEAFHQADDPVTCHNFTGPCDASVGVGCLPGSFVAYSQQGATAFNSNCYASAGAETKENLVAAMNNSTDELQYAFCIKSA